MVVRSEDRGRTFSPPILVATPDESCLYGASGPRWLPTALTKLLAADRSASAYANRIYAIWNDCRSGRSQIVLTWSPNGGKSWSQPRPVDSQAPDSATQFLPAIAVNRDGVVGISWLDTRQSSGGDRVDAYFAASVDGGESFLPAVRVSSESSTPTSVGNLTLDLREWNHGETGITAFLNSAYAFRPDGGDYMGLASDVEGGFHYVWADSRTGSVQIWTSRISVVPVARNITATSIVALPEDITDKVTLELDHVAYDTERKEHQLWVRIRSLSAHPVCRPLVVQFTSWPYPGIRLTNASNGKMGEGATFDYDRALRDLDRLSPYGVTEPLEWRAGGESTVSFSAKVTGRPCG